MSETLSGAAGPVLVIGALAGPQGARRVALHELSRDLLDRIAPVQVNCALFDRDGDALAVAEALAALGWQGVLVVVAPALPDRRMIAAELRAAAPGVTIEIVTPS